MNLRRLKLLEKAVVKEPLLRMTYWAEVMACGTAHCAAGAFASRYPSQGLKLFEPNGAFCTVGTLCSTDGVLVGLDACASVFGLTEKQATHLFCQESYRRPDKPAVLRRIRSYIRKAERERARRKAVRA